MEYKYFGYANQESVNPCSGLRNEHYKDRVDRESLLQYALVDGLVECLVDVLTYEGWLRSFSRGLDDTL